MKRKKSKKVKTKVNLEALLDRKKELESLLSTLEDSYREGAISETSYQEIKEKNLKQLVKLGKRIEKLQAKKEEKLKKLEEEVKKVEKREEVFPEITEEKEERAKEKKKGIFEIFKKEEVPEESKEPVEIPEEIPVETPKKEMEVEPEGKLLMEIEKIKATIDAIKETKAATDERISRLIESIGELRSMVFHREAASKEIEAKVEKISDIISDLEPQKFAKELAKRDKEISSHDMRIEKIEVITKDMLQNMKAIRAALEGFGNLENFINLSKSINEKILKIENIAKNVDRLSDKMEKLYIEMNKRVEEFAVYRSKQDTLDELLKETMKSVDSISLKLSDFITKSEFGALRDSIANLEKEIAEARSLKVPEGLEAEKASIEELISSLEEEFKAGRISEEEYNKAREFNLKKLAEIEKREQKKPKRVELEEEVEPVKITEERKVPKVLKELYEKGLITEKTFKKAAKVLA